MNTEIDTLLSELEVMIRENSLDKSMLTKEDPDNKFGLAEYYNNRAVVLDNIVSKLTLLASLEK